MKKISLFLQFGLLSLVFLAGCVKDRNVGPDFSSTDPVLELRTPVKNIAGLAYFGNAVIGNLPDTSQFYVNLASEFTIDHDLNVTIGVDASKIDEYNADANNSVKYELLPDSIYQLFKTSGTIVKGQRIDSFQIAFYKDKIDPTRNYMLPVAITEGDGILISGNQGVIWYHAIGNPLAGAYLWDYTRWPYPDSTTGDYDTKNLGVATSFAPDDPTTVEVQSGYYIGPHYVLTFDNDGGVLSNFQLILKPEDVATMAGAGVSILDGPHIITADPVNKVFEFYYEAYNGSAYRFVKDKYYKP